MDVELLKNCASITHTHSNPPPAPFYNDPETPKTPPETPITTSEPLRTTLNHSRATLNNSTTKPHRTTKNDSKPPIRMTRTTGSWWYQLLQFFSYSTMWPTGTGTREGLAWLGALKLDGGGSSGSRTWSCAARVSLDCSLFGSSVDPSWSSWLAAGGRRCQCLVVVWVQTSPSSQTHTRTHTHQKVDAFPDHRWWSLERMTPEEN